MCKQILCISICLVFFDIKGRNNSDFNKTGHPYRDYFIMPSMLNGESDEVEESSKSLYLRDNSLVIPSIVNQISSISIVLSLTYLA